MIFCRNCPCGRVHDLNVARVEEALLSGEKYFAGGEVLLIHVETLFHSVAYGLFAVNVLAGIEGIHHYVIMGVERRCHNHGIYVFVGQKGSVVFVGFGFGRYFESRLQRGLIDVGQCHYPGFRIAGYEAHEELTARAWADNAHTATLFVGVVYFAECRQPRACGCEYAGSGYSEPTKKIRVGLFFVFVHGFILSGMLAGRYLVGIRIQVVG